MEMKLIPKWAKIDLAVLPIGDVATMGAEDAVIASDFVECNRVLGVHYDALPFTKIDHAAAKKSFDAAGKELVLLEVGDSISV